MQASTKHTPPFIRPREWMIGPTIKFKMDFSSSISVIKKIPLRRAQRPFSQMILDFARLAIKH